ncbi:unnamed protein product [Allacma fusca]|uniref:Uncharacterized protein n=1 Tax=Allacma fusca TaxID=39272 RepID=A0A8J2PBB2_9HEXA|nr:unnamed protein product [Allacma fusca]
MAGAHADLRFLKQLALNSIELSAMSSSEKLVALERWKKLWVKFLDKVTETFEPEFIEINKHKNKYYE